MTFRLAPKGQPTESIERMLKEADRQLGHWRRVEAKRAQQLVSAKGMVSDLEADVAQYQWQLEQRKAEEVNGL